MRLHRLATATAALAVVGLAAGCGTGSPEPAAAPSTSDTVPSTIGDDELYAIAMSTAAELGEDHPTNMQAVLTTRSGAAHLIGAEVPDDTPAYLIQVEGTFSTDWMHRPGGVEVPPTVTGAVTVVVDAHTGAAGGVGTNPPLDLATLGPVKTLHG
ncbi:MAG: hypothetical protein FWE39_12445 [Nocardiaceae bacterium]|nr:hypothetical protein [Nocardiaceae bacterium]